MTTRTQNAVKANKTQKTLTLHATVNKMPKGNGGVRFSVMSEGGLSDFYMDQEAFALLGLNEKSSIRVQIVREDTPKGK